LIFISAPVTPSMPDNPAQSHQGPLPTVQPRAEVKLRAGIKFLQPPRREPIIVTVFDDFVGVHDDGDEEGEHNIDEEADERVKVDSAVDPHRHGLVYGDTTEGSKHVITIDERKKGIQRWT